MKDRISILLNSILPASILCLPVSGGTPQRACEFVSSIGVNTHFGLVRFDCSVKPAYSALKNLIAVLRDDTAAFAPASFSYTLAGDTANVRTDPLQLRDYSIGAAL